MCDLCKEETKPLGISIYEVKEIIPAELLPKLFIFTYKEAASLRGSYGYVRTKGNYCHVGSYGSKVYWYDNTSLERMEQLCSESMNLRIWAPYYREIEG